LIFGLQKSGALIWLTTVIAVLKVRALNDWNIWRCFACESVVWWSQQQRGGSSIGDPLFVSTPRLVMGFRRDAPTWRINGGPAVAELSSQEPLHKSAKHHQDVGWKIFNFGPNCCVKPDLRINAISQMMV
jgi:hypothetical protein